jgi:hypothetical protein
LDRELATASRERAQSRITPTKRERIVVNEVPPTVAERSPVRIGVFMTLVAVGFAALIGVIAVADANSTGSAVGIGAVTAVAVFIAGGTIACALACLVRRRTETLALMGIAAAALAIDLFVLATWREIDDETYGKLTAIAFIWTIFGLPMLGLALAVRPREQLARALFLEAMVTAIAAGLIATWLIASTGGEITPLSPFGLSSIADESLLRPLAVALVLLSTSWFGALAASRLEQS